MQRASAIATIRSCIASCVTPRASFALATELPDKKRPNSWRGALGLGALGVRAMQLSQDLCPRGHPPPLPDSQRKKRGPCSCCACCVSCAANMLPCDSIRHRARSCGRCNTVPMYRRVLRVCLTALHHLSNSPHSSTARMLTINMTQPSVRVCVWSLVATTRHGMLRSRAAWRESVERRGQEEGWYSWPEPHSNVVFL
jgi:hypothetical protein